jgi:hypothetical protein
MPKPTSDEIDKVLDDVIEQQAKGGSRYPGMTYEEGIDATIRWMNGDSDENPYEDE